jgi:hypothetical protein
MFVLGSSEHMSISSLGHASGSRCAAQLANARGKGYVVAGLAALAVSIRGLTAVRG